MIVNLVTKSKVLEDLMLSEYPGLLFEWQIKKVGDEENKKYIFTNLDYRELNLFLAGRKDYFTIYESESKRFIETSPGEKPVYH
ncbi:hypothetical protein COU59_03285 [Candidatus Pacearchaeota archaeon CG10_big_fil_rev_8_21_14_0_10_34_12]|nr:MAG: hypothetical protein COU59_03285 [Candidatus Pacearchaeota archaeon CG10_big_fil_rev_8_21_14_0_10_34_12]